MYVVSSSIILQECIGFENGMVVIFCLFCLIFVIVFCCKIHNNILHFGVVAFKARGIKWLDLIQMETLSEFVF